ncbi:hypothetical protein C8Q75DRAFT_772174 [Abortiporus biennis]|nr:hypothetical protein C8Q75DRAFT_772174 [Abortiporus biennis]
MSDLDADLYGDLYGNDDQEFAVPTDAPEDRVTAEPEPTTPAKSSSTPTKPSPSESSTTQAKQSSAPASTSETPQPSSVTSALSTQPVATYTSQTATQQIPTYQERQDTDYHVPQTPQQGAQYSGQIDRPVRPSEMKEEGKMFIGGLNWDTTDESLRKYFSQFGKVEACTIMRDAAGRSRCFAFLTFEDPASVNAVMVREHFLDGKIIDPKRAIPRQEHQRATKLFIGGLAGSVTSESMREFFSQFGKVVDSTVMLDRETGRSKGFGFISFEGANVEPILGFGNLEIDGKLIDVKLAQPRSQRENFAENGTSTTPATTVTRNFSGGSFNNQGAAFTSGTTNVAPATPSGNAPFDPQALASLYQRMISQMNPMMGMNMMGGMGGAGPAAYGGMNAMRMGGMAAGGMPNAGMMGNMAMGGMPAGGMGMSRGGMTGAGNMMGGAMNPNIPRGPRGAPAGPNPAAGVGPQRLGQRGQHNFHPYAR